MHYAHSKNELTLQNTCYIPSIALRTCNLQQLSLSSNYLSKGGTSLVPIFLDKEGEKKAWKDLVFLNITKLKSCRTGPKCRTLKRNT